MKMMSLYMKIGSDFTLYFTASSENNTPLFNGNGKVNREVLEKKRQEMFGLPSANKTNLEARQTLTEAELTLLVGQLDRVSLAAR